jgi:hypothetical protein
LKISKRLVITFFILLVILFVGLLNWSFVLNEIIMPVSLVIWFFLRILVLSIDQQYYWTALIFVVLVFLSRLIPQDQSPITSEDSYTGNETIKRIENWHRLFIPENNSIYDDITLRRGFSHMVVSLYAIKLHVAPDFRLVDSLKQGEIPLPEQIRTFLFPEEPQKPGRSLKKRMQSTRNALRQWIRRLNGQEKAEHYRMINELLDFLETSLEMKNDNEKFYPNQH